METRNHALIITVVVIAIAIAVAVFLRGGVDVGFVVCLFFFWFVD